MQKKKQLVDEKRDRVLQSVWNTWNTHKNTANHSWNIFREVEKRKGLESVFIRRVDPMRRVTLPSELAEKYQIKVGDEVEILDNGSIVIRPLEKRCVVCGEEKELVSVKNERLCLSCLDEASEEASRKAEAYRSHLKLIR